MSFFLTLASFFLQRKIPNSFCVYLFISRGIVNAGNAYELLSTGCETAGGLATPLNDKELSDIANGGKDQKNEGCTLDAHCDQSSFCHVGTSESECVASPPTPTTPPGPGTLCPSGQKIYQVTVIGDGYPTETSYTLKNVCSGEVILSGCDCVCGEADVSEATCADAQRMEFVIRVSLFLRVFNSVHVEIINC